jgi:hypothetical protein
MGCFASVSAPDLIIISHEEDENIGELVKEYNEFCRKSKEILRFSIQVSKKIDPLLLKLIEDSKKTGSIAMKIQECFMALTICILHYQQSKRESFRVMFSNFLPGVLVEPFELSPKLRAKYENLIKLCGALPGVLKHFGKLCEEIVKCLALARDYYPKEFYARACFTSGFSLVKFAEVERDLIDNFDMIAETGKMLDNTFKNCKDCIRVVYRIVEKCDKNLEEVLAILDGIDELNYDVLPELVTTRIDEFLNKHDIKLTN